MESHFALGSPILIPFFFAHNSKEHFPHYQGSEMQRSIQIESRYMMDAYAWCATYGGTLCWGQCMITSRLTVRQHGCQVRDRSSRIIFDKTQGQWTLFTQQPFCSDIMLSGTTQMWFCCVPHHRSYKCRESDKFSYFPRSLNDQQLKRWWIMKIQRHLDFW